MTWAWVCRSSSAFQFCPSAAARATYIPLESIRRRRFEILQWVTRSRFCAARRKASSIGAQRARAQRGRAILTRKNQLEAAIGVLRAAIEIDSGLTLAYLALGAALAQSGRIGEAKDALRHGLRVDPSMVEESTIWGWCARQHGREPGSESINPLGCRACRKHQREGCAYGRSILPRRPDTLPTSRSYFPAVDILRLGSYLAERERDSVP